MPFNEIPWAQGRPLENFLDLPLKPWAGMGRERFGSVVGGVAVVAGTIAALELSSMVGVEVPNPQLFTALAITFAAFIGGYAAGLTGAALGVAYGVYFFSTPGTFLEFTPANAARVAVNVITLPAIAILTSHLRYRLTRETFGRVRKFLDAAAAPIIGVDAKGLVNIWNDAAIAEIGWPREWVIGRPLTDLLTEEDEKKALSESLFKLVQGAASEGIEVSVSAKSGEPVRILVRFTADRDAQGDLLGAVGVAQNVTLLKSARDALEQSRARFRDFAEMGADRLWECDGDYRLTYRWQRMGGSGLLKNDDFIGRTWWEIHTAPESRTSIEVLRKKMESREEFRNCLLRLFNGPDGRARYRMLSGRPIFDAAGRFAGYRGVATEVTDEILAREATAVLQERLEGILSHSTSGIMLADTEGHVILANRRFSEWYGASAMGVGAAMEENVFKAREAESCIEMNREVLASSKPVEREIEFSFVSGGKHPVLVTKFPVYSPAGALSAIGTIHTDLTEVRDAQNRLAQSQRLEVVGQLTGGIAHDFNNLLAVIQGNGEMLREQVAPLEDSGAADAILRAVNRGSELTGRLLAFARRQSLRPEVVDLADLVGHARDLLRRTLPTNIEIRTEFADGLWFVNCDPGQLENALLNLAINARDAMPAGGTLSITCRNIPAREISAAAPGPIGGEDEGVLAPGDYIAIDVTDTGTGMPAEVIAHAFEPFFTTKDAGKGSGLGLSMVYGFARQSGGAAVISSEPGNGATVSIFLPRTDAPAHVRAERQNNNPIKGSGQVILVLEDMADVLSLVRRMLEKSGYRVLCASNTEDARRHVEAANPKVELILSDVMLAGRESGPKFTAAIHAEHPDIEVLMMSGFPAEAARSAGIIGKDTEILRKPFTRETLVRAVRHALER
jgi:PAS domain S-box-containing protein